MASLRDRILEELAERIGAIGNGWVATTRKQRNPHTGEKQAIVLDERETKTSVNNWFYDCDLFIVVVLRARWEKAEPDPFNGDVFRYLDAMVVDVEKVVHASPIEWGINGVTDVQVSGHDKEPPAKENIVRAFVRVRVRYRHNFDNPEVYDPAPRLE